MMPTHKIYGLIFIVIISFYTLYSCSSPNNYIAFQDNLPQEKPEILEFQISEILKPIDIAINDNYICILHEEKQQGEQIYVFDADNLEFKYKFARRGLGPEETIALDIVKTLKGDTIDLIDQSNRKKLTYLLTETKPQLIKESHISIPQVGPLQEVYWLSDSILIFNTVEGDIITYNDNENTIIDSINIYSLITGIDDNLRKQIGTFHYSLLNNEVIVGFRFFKRLLRIPLEDDYIFDFSQAKHFSGNEINADNFNDNYAFFSYLASNNNFVVAQYYGKTLKSLRPFPFNINGQDLNYDIIIFDSNLNLLHNYDTGMPILRVFLDDKRDRVFFWNTTEDFNSLNYIQL